MEILGRIIWLLTGGYGIFCLIAFLYEVFWPDHYTDGPQVFYPFFLRRLITGFEALGFLGAAIVIELMQVSKFHILWFAPVWYFFGLPRWFEWIYLYYNPELIDLIYPEYDTPWWFSLLCPFSPSLVPDIIRKIHKSRGRKFSVHDANGFHTKFVNITGKTVNAEEFDPFSLAKRNNWPPKKLEEMNKIQRAFFWLGAGAFINLIIMFLLFLLILLYIALGIREVEESVPVIFGSIKYMIGMIGISFTTWIIIYILRDKK